MSRKAEEALAAALVARHHTADAHPHVRPVQEHPSAVTKRLDACLYGTPRIPVAHRTHTAVLRPLLVVWAVSRRMALDIRLQGTRRGRRDRSRKTAEDGAGRGSGKCVCGAVYSSFG